MEVSALVLIKVLERLLSKGVKISLEKDETLGFSSNARVLDGQRRWGDDTLEMALTFSLSKAERDATESPELSDLVEDINHFQELLCLISRERDVDKLVEARYQDSQKSLKLVK